MTPEQLAASLIADVPRYELNCHSVELEAKPNGNWLSREEVLAALARAMGPDDLVADAGKTMEGLRELGHLHMLGRCLSSADLITALLARLAAQEAQMKGMEEAIDANWITHQRVVAAETALATMTKERDELRGGVTEPHDPGDFVGDIYYGHPEYTTLGTHRWTGSEWVRLPSDTEALMALLASARTALAAQEAQIERQAAGHREDLNGIADISVERLRRAEAAEAALAAERAKVARLVEALRKYRETLCEGFCKGDVWADEGHSHPDIQRDCGGCLAASVLLAARAAITEAGQ